MQNQEYVLKFMFVGVCGSPYFCNYLAPGNKTWQEYVLHASSKDHALSLTSAYLCQIAGHTQKGYVVISLLQHDGEFIYYTKPCLVEEATPATLPFLVAKRQWRKKMVEEAMKAFMRGFYVRWGNELEKLVA